MAARLRWSWRPKAIPPTSIEPIAGSMRMSEQNPTARSVSVATMAKVTWPASRVASRIRASSSRSRGRSQNRYVQIGSSSDAAQGREQVVDVLRTGRLEAYAPPLEDRVPRRGPAPASSRRGGRRAGRGRWCSGSGSPRAALLRVGSSQCLRHRGDAALDLVERRRQRRQADPQAAGVAVVRDHVALPQRVR